MTHYSNTNNLVDFPGADTMEEQFNKEIARECLLEVDADQADALLETIWPMCRGNPWDAVPLYHILKKVDKL